ncbi:DUF6494 family protein [Roseivivax isoporae]|uniref:Uncharacterized protein n=1 Tax=Roseivivax isoporae LMG 25204 TaxID=1449351 RepID=X7FBL8_9RHOB|nr:DUF6494 family protein [Roseivivax isoporae]ETX30302.1 hypothetical protein RISW2_15820 [Roseivivax isoporae LMG 25204]
MTDEDFNMSMRKFLKQVGVTSQQAIEEAVRNAAAEGRALPDEVPVKVVLTSDALGLEHVVEGRIKPARDSGGAA